MDELGFARSPSNFSFDYRLFRIYHVPRGGFLTALFFNRYACLAHLHVFLLAFTLMLATENRRRVVVLRISQLKLHRFPAFDKLLLGCAPYMI